MKNSKQVWVPSVVGILSLIGIGEVQAFNIDSHRLLNSRTAAVSTLDDYLKQQLGFPGGIVETFSGRQAREWIRDGGAAEDQAFRIEFLGAAFRSRHHFHNPLLSWDQAGLNATSFCPPFVLVGEASVRWAQDPNQGLSGQAAWSDARKSFLKALTLPSKADRDAAFAQTFQILGQQMHLIADLAAPAHTRNDAHCPSPDGFEAWVSSPTNDALVQGLLAGPPVRPDPSIFTVGVPISDRIAKVPVARLWDTDQYVKTNPDITLSSSIGLAEYSNANFFSDNTVFSSELPFPASMSVEIGSPEPEPETGELRRYFKKVRDGEPVDHLAVPSALYEFLPEALKDQKKGLDYHVFQDYAAKLLPRAVGYSAALLDYFFRGQFTIERVAVEVQAGVVRVRVRNLGDERMKGNVTFYYDDQEDSLRKKATRGVPFIVDLGPGSAAEYRFDTFVDRARERMESHYIAVFEGQLGNDPTAVVATRVQITPPRLGWLCGWSNWSCLSLWFVAAPGATLTIEGSGVGNTGSVLIIPTSSDGDAVCGSSGDACTRVPVSFGDGTGVTTLSFTAEAPPGSALSGFSMELDFEEGGYVCISNWTGTPGEMGETSVSGEFANCPE